MTLQIKHEWIGSGKQLRWLDAIPASLDTDASDRLTIRNGSCEVSIRTDHPSTAPGSYAVCWDDDCGGSYWNDFGSDYAAAAAAALTLLGIQAVR